MIIRLTGGIGNQMFQYAYGRSRSLESNTPLKYFFVHYRCDTNRNFQLNLFNITGRVVDPFFPGIIVKVENLFKIHSPWIEYGYWQSEKYFKRYEKAIRKDFTFRNKPNKANLELLKVIKSVNSVSIHVRRGDYVNDKKTKKFHGVLSTKYYKKAIEVINRKVEKPTYFIFSNDIEWCKNNFKYLEKVYFVEGNIGDKNHEDMRLMSNCKHNIIANSSFSWWGAWLNTNPNKIVIAPKKWFIDYKAQKEIGDEIVPKTWIKI